MTNEVTIIPDVRDRMAEALNAGADASEVEIRLENIESTTITFQKDSLESLDKGVSVGGCVRALVNGSWGFSSFNSLDNLMGRVREAVDIARALGPGQAKLSVQEPREDIVPVRILRDPRSVPVSETLESVKKYNDIMLKSDGVVSTYSTYRHFHYRRWFMNTSGTFTDQEKLKVTLILMAMVLDSDGMVQEGRDFLNSMIDYDVVVGAEESAEIAVRDAREIAGAPKVKGGKYPVIVNPDLAGTFIHEAFGHLS